MKKSREIKLILITAALASCNRPARNEWTALEHRDDYIDYRRDYERVYTDSNSIGMWYYSFRPFSRLIAYRWWPQHYYGPRPWRQPRVFHYAPRNGIHGELRTARPSHNHGTVTHGGFGSHATYHSSFAHS